MVRKEWDVIIVGGGPAGLSAGFYLARAGQRALLLEKNTVGGKTRFLKRIENYPGFPQGVSGPMLIERLRQQGRRYGLNVCRERVCNVETLSEGFLVYGERTRWRTSAVLSATGTTFKRLDVEGEGRLYGKGLYNASWEASGQEKSGGTVLGVIGGGETAAHQALELAEHARRVILFVRSAELKVSGHLAKRVSQCRRIEVRTETHILSFKGGARLEGVAWSKSRESRIRMQQLTACFVLVGQEPCLPPGFKEGEGMFIAGDLRSGMNRQSAVAAADGLASAMECERYLRERENVLC